MLGRLLIRVVDPVFARAKTSSPITSINNWYPYNFPHMQETFQFWNGARVTKRHSKSKFYAPHHPMRFLAFLNGWGCIEFGPTFVVTLRTGQMQSQVKVIKIWLVK
jgi:hypothetical protein